MKVLANENFPRSSFLLLRQAGWDVCAISEESPGIKDSEVLARAAREQRVILTFDRDYGELIFRFGQASLPAGVIYLRYRLRYPEEPGEHLLKLCEISELMFEGKFTVLERNRLRQRPLSR